MKGKNYGNENNGVVWKWKLVSSFNTASDIVRHIYIWRRKKGRRIGHGNNDDAWNVPNVLCFIQS